jgi:signal transduction histidine kinase/CheY-like chemotaxis protein
LLYIFLVSAARFILVKRYWRTPNHARTETWTAAFALGAGLAGLGWGASGILLYPGPQMMSQVFLVFVLGGMMLGGASLLAPRPESFLAFLIPTGVLPAVRLASEGDTEHVAMGTLAAVFTIAVLSTTWRFYRTIESSLSLQFENEHLVKELQIANAATEALNQELEVRVLERTAELHEATVRLRDEMERREQVEEELWRARNLESLGVLAGGIAHDFNNFLTIVQGNIELAKMRLSENTPVREILDQTAGACQRAAFLSSQLLTFAKGGAPVRRVVSVAKLILDAVHLARAGAPISIGVEIADDLWCAEVDAAQIGQVLYNILLNAKQAMPEGGIIEVRAQNIMLPDDRAPDAEAHVIISVRDYGSGIAADILPRIFDPYFTTKKGGSGLGLATAYAIVSKHGGRISVDSRYGDGAVFTIDLPASQQRLEPDAPAGQLRSGTGKVLVMDDEEAVRTLLAHALTTLGYEVQTARDGAEAITLYEAAIASESGFDVVVLDLTVSGGMGGIETAAKLKELNPFAKLIVSSGYSDAPVMSKFREYGFDDAIAKPWKIDQLSEVLGRILMPHPKREGG